MEVYLDNSATTRVDDNVIQLMTRVMREDFGNPSSKHMKGVESERYLRGAREIIAKILKVNEKEIFFTSGGTESNNTALICGADANKRAGKHIITTVFEHASVLEPMKYLEGQGFEVTYLPVDGSGHISHEDLKAAIRPDTILVSVMMVNNEMGAVQDVAEIGKLVKAANPNALLHVDAIQAFGKYEIYPKKMNVDMLSASSHKFHGPKGCGFLYINEKVKIHPMILGGGQQKGMRSGTDNVPGVAGMALAAYRMYYKEPDQAALNAPNPLSALKCGELTALHENAAKMRALKDELEAGITELGNRGIKVKINSLPGEEGAPHIVSATFKDVKSEVLLHALEDVGIYVSSGSACSSNKRGLSGTLMAIGLSAGEADNTLRFSFCEDNTSKEVQYTIEKLAELVPVLSKFVPR